MAVSTEISLFDHVKLLAAVDGAPAGARAGVLEFYDDGREAMLEILEPNLGDLERIVVAPVSQLRRVS